MELCPNDVEYFSIEHKIHLEWITRAGPLQFDNNNSHLVLVNISHQGYPPQNCGIFSKYRIIK